MTRPFETLAVDAHGLALYARERPGTGTTSVLLLHGWLEHGHAFDWLAEHLPESWRVLLLDWRGMGRSAWLPRPGNYQLTDYVLDVEAVLDAAGLKAAHLVGHSLGGIAATLYAAARPERVLSLSLIESLGPTGGAPDNALARLRGFVEDQKRAPSQKRYPNVEAAAARLRESNPDLSEAAALHLTRHGTTPHEGGVVFTFDPTHRRRFGLGPDEAQWLALSSAITCPVQLIRGREGLWLDEERAEARVKALRLARPPLILPGGHHVHMDEPQAMALALVDFIGP
jgi:pimeloyl-ACP methyl ester carboxylesterase